MVRMGKLILLALVVLAAVLVWKAFGPASWNQNRQATSSAQRPAIKGPDDDEEFLWNIEKNRFKERRRQEQEQQRQSRERGREQGDAKESGKTKGPGQTKGSDNPKDPGNPDDKKTNGQ